MSVYILIGKKAECQRAQRQRRWLHSCASAHVLTLFACMHSILSLLLLRWANNHLRKKNFPLIESIENDFEDGIRLMQLIAALYDLPIPKHNATPKMRPHKV